MMKYTRTFLTSVLLGMAFGAASAPADPLEKDFVAPPDAARPGVYWYFMDGNFNGPEMLKDLDSMKEVGLGNALFLEVDAGVPRGPVKFMSEEWQNLVTNAFHYAERLGIDITLGAGPGWCGSGGPWVKPEQSMQHLVSSSVDTKGPAKFDGVLPMPAQRIDAWHNMANPFYEDVVVYAFPKCNPVITDIDEKALYGRNPFSSMPGVKAYLPAPTIFPEPDKSNVIDPAKLIDLTSRLRADGKLAWDVPAGEWTILRMGRRSTGANTRPAPVAGTGLEHDKFDPAALDEHFANYCGKLLTKLGPRAKQHGWTAVHLDSWEMGAQNWTPKFRDEFRKRRGYDPQPFFVTFSGRAIKSMAESERFLWDMRLTTQELIVENYAGHLKELGRKNGLELSIEPYDMNPTADLTLGSVADVPMCEFWSAGMGFDSSFSCIEASSIAHTMGRPIVAAESFTAASDSWQQYPWSMKNQGDWALCIGVNRFVYHTFAHKPLGDECRPGMTMGPYGVHWDRGQSWWPLVKDYHQYITRCSHLLRQGVTVSDVLYLTPEGAPHVFRPPPSALSGSAPLADKKGYGFDGCAPNILIERAEVKDGRIVFPGGTSYQLLVLPRSATMTPRLLGKIIQLVQAGAVVYGAAPVASPSLSGYPKCDAKVRELAESLWGTPNSGVRQLGKGRIIPDSAVDFRKDNQVADAPMLPNVGSWIWFDEGNPTASAPVGDVHFRYTLDIPDLALVKKARIEATADNSFALKINDKLVLSGDNFHIIYASDVLSALRPGKNTITVLANNTGPDANPAGFIAAIRLTKADDSQEVISTDQRWSASRNAADWAAAKLLGPGNMPPWQLSGSAAPEADLYPAYATTAALLEKMNVPPDFQADGPVRYAHRETADKDIYFITNTTSGRVKTTCTFRVEKGRPQLWDPVTAEIRALPQFVHQGKTTTVPVTLEPHQSFFVIFTREGPATAVAATKGVNFVGTSPVATLDGDWDVAFDPKFGGPEKATFKSLQDWTTREERGIKYYSGIATYHKTFDLPKEGGDLTREPARKIYLDLGTVHDMARVRLNGKDLGVVWCAPWRIEITGAVKDKANQLEISVANRWSNRMLGDQQAPDKDVRTVKWPSGLLGGQEFKTGRYTFATAAGLGALLPSGLLGPVRITAQGLAAEAAGEGTISNVRPRRDVLGNIVDAHDGCLELFKGKYYLYGTRYGSTDGFGKTNRYVCYSSPDLVTWTPHGEILKDAPPRTYYRPYVKYNRSTGKYVMWYNADNQYGVAVADDPAGPFIISNPNVPVKYSSHGIGDMGLFIDDDGTAYLAYTVIGTGDFGGKVEPISHHQICVEKLTGDYLSSTQVASAFVAGNCEGPAMFKRKGIYYLLFDNTCCFGVDGSGARVFTSTSPMGPFQYMGNINIKAASARNLPSPWTPPGSGRPDCIIKAQQTHVATLPTNKGTVYIWMGDRWGSRPDGIKGHDFQFWSSPLQFEDDGMIQSLTWDRDIGDKNFVRQNPTASRIVIDKAKYGDLTGNDPRRILDLTKELQQQVDGGEDIFMVSSLIRFKGDPALGFVKTLTVEFHLGGTAMSKSATDPESIDLLDAGGP